MIRKKYTGKPGRKDVRGKKVTKLDEPLDPEDAKFFPRRTPTRKDVEKSENPNESEI